MINPQLTLDDVIHLTLQVGEDWAVAHAERLLELIQQIGTGLSYNFQIMELAAYMHDWGAFPAYTQKDVEHAIRSRQVVQAEILPCLDLTPAQKTTLLEAIELHDYRDRRPTKSNEALLLREADMLEFLGMIGMAREFARGPRNVETCYKRILSRRNAIQGCFTIPRAQEIARTRLERMQVSLQWLLEESFGVL
ncbi:MAG TPA: HD domain-containing protein [Anaerolineales bacterium]|nr:HD domain-containing protein [Anaerolineales bacterium]